MQLILSIDDIGIKKNMSSDVETNQTEKKNKKTEIRENNLTSSPVAPSIAEENTEKREQTVETSLNSCTWETKGNDISTDNNPSGNGEIVKTEDGVTNEKEVETKLETETGNNIIQEEYSNKKQFSVHDVIMNEKEVEKELKTETRDNILQEEYSNEMQFSVHDDITNDKEVKTEIQTKTGDNILQEEYSNEKQFSVHDVSVKNCDNNKDSDLKLSIKTEELSNRHCQDANVLNTNAEETNINDVEIKRESCEYVTISDVMELDLRSSASVALKTSVCEPPDHAKGNQESVENGINSNVSSPHANQKDIEEKKLDNINANVIDDVILDDVENCNKEDLKSQINSIICSVNEEVIDIADEKDSIESADNEVTDNKIEGDLAQKNEDVIIQQSADGSHQNPNSKENETITIDEDIIDIADEKDSCDSIKDKNDQNSKTIENKTESDQNSEPNENLSYTKNEDQDATNVATKLDCVETSKTDIESSNRLNKSELADKVTSYKLRVTLDILSDDEEENISKPVSPKSKQETKTNDKQSMNIEEDDDIMVIDDESSVKEEKETLNTNSKDTPTKDNDKDAIDTIVKTGQDSKKGDKPKIANDPKPEIKTSEDTKSTSLRNPLLSSTSLKSFKKNLAEMTREELEDFCILTIAEAVFDRSNLGELKSHIKILNQNLEDYKTRALNLAKQNRDLQVVLKSVQEEQKKNSDTPITPLKITRSVGMQVLMSDKISRKRHAAIASQVLQNSTIPAKPVTTPNNSKLQNKPAASPNVNTKNSPRQPQQQQQQIPVPRLVPAVSPAPKPTPSVPQPVFNVKSPASNVPNGVRAATPSKPEKRTHNKMQQNSGVVGAVTVDLTDDEPPTKVVTRNYNSPVRCVPPQSLLAPRPSAPVTNPRKVYIPISGQQAQNIRPGQQIMLKSVSSQGAGRQRAPPNIKIAPNLSGGIRNPRINHRHPAPLPELTKQYQPSNWKALPPAPELKLAKVENGIVISWKIDGYREENHEEIASYQLFAYQETSQPPNTSLWKKIGDVKALPLPMACTLTQFMSGYKYYFAVRAVDVKSRFGPFSLPGSILLLKN